MMLDGEFHHCDILVIDSLAFDSPSPTLNFDFPATNWKVRWRITARDTCVLNIGPLRRKVTDLLINPHQRVKHLRLYAD